jgi:hypothetical protein
MRALPSAVAAALVLFLLVPCVARAQRPWPPDTSRAGRPGAYVPYDGAPFSHRYNYPDPPLFLWGEYGRNWWVQYELDREERFEKFGTRYGPDHPPLFNRLLERRRR